MARMPEYRHWGWSKPPPHRLRRTCFYPPNGNRSAGNYGTIPSTQQPREIQFALRYSF